ncbi:putative Tubulin glycylase 3D [Blattamonas nauphoetae]|uniref:Tubulin glycylase 3D n=1 Tax=Blattamonas nauphoetae TaxID=2049346 RepID=A0ABQ9XC76_9EUKA|nr:putative Tubulin glycylase 3D [Blattamonas nauphoetae]
MLASNHNSNSPKRGNVVSVKSKSSSRMTRRSSSPVVSRKPPKMYVVFNSGDCTDDVRQAMSRRLWDEIDQNKHVFNFRWTIKTVDLSYTNLKDSQLTNHFPSTAILTTKSGLNTCLKENAHWECVDHRTFFPMCFDLREKVEKDCFVETFRILAAFHKLRDFLAIHDRESFLRLPKKDLTSVQLLLKVLSNHISCTLERKTQSECDGDCELTTQPIKLSEAQWKQIGPECAVKKALTDLVDASVNPISRSQSSLRFQTRPQIQSMSRSQSTLRKSTRAPVEGSKTIDRETTKHNRNESTPCGTICGTIDEEPTEAEQQQLTIVYDNAQSTLKQMESDELVQSLSRLGTKHNMWIVKPTGKSRGRGIAVHSSLSEIFKHIAEGKDKFLIQKYIERPFLIHGFKFDIRLWIMVTSVNPLSIWYYHDPYIRFSSVPFSLDCHDGIVHLTNNCVQSVWEKESKVKTLRETIGDEIGVEGNMWRWSQFEHYLEEIDAGKPGLVWCSDKDTADQAKQAPSSLFNKLRTQTIPLIRRIVTTCFLCGRDKIKDRPNSFEIYGFDFMLDEDLSPWLIEINSAPSFEHSTTIVGPLVTQCIEDTMKVVLDNRMCDRVTSVGGKGAPRRSAAHHAEEQAIVASDECSKTMTRQPSIANSAANTTLSLPSKPTTSDAKTHKSEKHAVTPKKVRVLQNAYKNGVPKKTAKLEIDAAQKAEQQRKSEEERRWKEEESIRLAKEMEERLQIEAKILSDAADRMKAQQLDLSFDQQRCAKYYSGLRPSSTDESPSSPKQDLPSNDSSPRDNSPEQTAHEESPTPPDIHTPPSAGTSLSTPPPRSKGEKQRSAFYDQNMILDETCTLNTGGWELIYRERKEQAFFSKNPGRLVITGKRIAP